MKILIGLLIAMTTTHSYSDDSIKIFHYNIKELDTQKIQKSNSNQLEYVKKIIKQYEFDILSLNEIQYDLPKVPTPNNLTQGKNLEFLRNLFNLKNLSQEVFFPANTGEAAKPRANGNYYQDPNDPEARLNADPVNFGTMPSQYSTGAIFKYKKIREVVIKDLKWKDFNPNLDLSKYADINGKPYPEDMALFDKNFTDVVLDINGKELHLILLHTVPSFHFGNMKTVNYIRNEDQLKFMEWYLTGSTDFEVKLKSVKHLKKNDYYIAVGDWNTDYNSTENPGSLVLRRMFSKNQLWLKDPKQLTFTNEGAGYASSPFRLMLDYIAYSNNIEIIEGKIILPNTKSIQLGCGKTKDTTKKPKDMIKVDWKQGDKTCQAYVFPEYRDFKQASDHYPIWGHFKLK